MEGTKLQVSVKGKLKLDGKKQIEGFKRMMKPYHEQGLEEAKAAMQDAIIKKEAYASGTLFESVSTRLFKSATEVFDGEVYFDNSASDYAMFVDKGRSPGKMPPVGKIEEWLDNTKSSIDADPYAIAKRIGKKGVKGKKFFALGSKNAHTAYRKAVMEGLKKFKGAK